MDTLQFKAKDEAQKQFGRELIKRTRNYFTERDKHTHGDYRMIIKAVLMLGIYLAPLVILFTVDLPAWFGIILMFLMGIGEAGIGMGVMHDAVHGSFSKHKWVNKLMGSSMFLLGSNVVNWKLQHNLFHHSYPNVKGWDGDIDSGGLLRLTEHEPEKKKYRFQYLFGPLLYGLMTLGRFIGDYKQLKDFNKRGALEVYQINYKKALFTLIVTKLAYLTVFLGLPFIFTDFTWWQILIGFLVMHITASAIMGTVFQMAHVVEDVDTLEPDENGVIHNSMQVHQLQTTSDFGRKNGLFSWYIGGLDFQVEHHLFPHICHIHYPKLALIVQQTAQEFNQPYHCQKSAYTAFRSHIRTLKRLGQV